ncbi:TRAP transporter small permease subunit [Sessilibacter sp. MAH1]
MNQTTPQEAGSVRFAEIIDRALIRISQAVAWIFFILMLVILAQVTLRRGFSAGLIILEELQWHLYAIGVFMGVIYAQARDTHVRVDVLRERYSQTARHVIEILGLTFLLMPFLWVVFYHGIAFTYEAWRINERSLAPAGLPWRWLIKGLIPLTMGLLMIAVLNRIAKESVLLVRHIKGGV